MIVVVDPLHRSETKYVERERGLCQHESDTERDVDERPRMYSCTKEILKLRRVGQQARAHRSAARAAAQGPKFLGAHIL
jgi:hypothetical protein